MNKKKRSNFNTNEIIRNLLNQAKYLAERVNHSLCWDEEGIFLDENKGKNIILLMKDGSEKGGSLLDIGNFGIIVQDDTVKRYIYKHAVAGYYID